MDKILIVILLFALAAFLMAKMIKPPTGPAYKLKTIIFSMGAEPVSDLTELGELIFISKGKRKFILPTELDLWTEVKLFKNGIVLKRNKKEKQVLFAELSSIEPFLVNSPFVKGKYFGYSFEFKNKKEPILLKSCNMNELDVFIEKLCELLPPEKAAVTDIG